MWFNRYNSLNFKLHFFKWTCSRICIFSRPKSFLITNQTLHNFFVKYFKRFSNECQLPSRYLNWVFKVSAVAAATQNRRLRSFFRNDRIALSVNSCGKLFHIEARQSSARQCWLVLACVASKYHTQMIMQWIELWRLKYQRCMLFLSQNRS